MSKNREIVYVDGSRGDDGDFPVAVVWDQESEFSKSFVVDPIFNSQVTRNLFGRVMTLVEATCEVHKLKAVKDLFAKELGDWESEVYSCARQIAEVNAGDTIARSPSNIYHR